MGRACGAAREGRHSQDGNERSPRGEKASRQTQEAMERWRGAGSTTDIAHDSDWMETTQNRERWRTVVAAARGLHGLQPAELSIIQDTSKVSIECVPAVTEYVSKILDSSSVLTYRYTARPSLLFE